MKERRRRNVGKDGEHRHEPEKKRSQQQENKFKPMKVRQKEGLIKCDGSNYKEKDKTQCMGHEKQQTQQC